MVASLYFLLLDLLVLIDLQNVVIVLHLNHLVLFLLKIRGIWTVIPHFAVFNRSCVEVAMAGRDSQLSNILFVDL